MRQYYNFIRSFHCTYKVTRIARYILIHFYVLICTLELCLSMCSLQQGMQSASKSRYKLTTVTASVAWRLNAIHCKDSFWGKAHYQDARARNDTVARKRMNDAWSPSYITERAIRRKRHGERNNVSPAYANNALHGWIMRRNLLRLYRAGGNIRIRESRYNFVRVFGPKPSYTCSRNGNSSERATARSSGEEINFTPSEVYLNYMTARAI